MNEQNEPPDTSRRLAELECRVLALEARVVVLSGMPFGPFTAADLRECGSPPAAADEVTRRLVDRHSAWQDEA